MLGRTWVPSRHHTQISVSRGKSVGQLHASGTESGFLITGSLYETADDFCHGQRKRENRTDLRLTGGSYGPGDTLPRR